jgi:hypothetical protein
MAGEKHGLISAFVLARRLAHNSTVVRGALLHTLRIRCGNTVLDPAGW